MYIPTPIDKGSFPYSIGPSPDSIGPSHYSIGQSPLHSIGTSLTV